MFSNHKNGHVQTLAIFLSCSFMNLGIASSDIFGGEPTPDKSTIPATRNYEPDSGEKGQPSTMTTIGGSRGDPDSIGLTAYIPENYKIKSKDPTFTWMVNDPTNKPIKFLLISDKETDPVFQKTYTAPHDRGKMVTKTPPLEQGESYTWIMFVCDTPSCYTSSAGSLRLNFRTY